MKQLNILRRYCIIIAIVDKMQFKMLTNLSVRTSAVIEGCGARAATMSKWCLSITCLSLIANYGISQCPLAPSSDRHTTHSSQLPNCCGALGLSTS